MPLSYLAIEFLTAVGILILLGVLVIAIPSFVRASEDAAPALGTAIMSKLDKLPTGAGVAAAAAIVVALMMVVVPPATKVQGCTPSREAPLAPATAPPEFSVVARTCSGAWPHLEPDCIRDAAGTVGQVRAVRIIPIR